MFKLMLQGKTIDDLRRSIEEAHKELCVETQAVPSEPEEQEDFLTEAAAQPIWPTPSAPSLASAPSPISHGAVDPSVDSKGMPWDARIHAATKALSKDGSWRYRRGVEDSTIHQVEQELIAKIKGAHVEQPAPVAPPLVFPSVPAIPAQPAPSKPPLPSPALTLPSAHTAQTFKQHLVPALAQLAKEGKVTQPYIQSLCQHFQVDQIHKISDQQAEDLFHMFVEHGLIASAE